MSKEVSHNNNLFREQALKNLNVIIEIQKPLQIVDPINGLCLFAGLLFLVGVLLWGICGRVSISVPAKGIILPENSQIIPVMAFGAGNVSEIQVKAGDKITKGEILANLTSPYSQENVSYLNNLYQANVHELYELKQRYAVKTQQLSEHFIQMEIMLKQQLIEQKNKMMVLNSLLIKKQDLYRRHYLTIPDIEKAKEEYFSAKEAYAKSNLTLLEASAQFKDAKDELDTKLNAQIMTLIDSKHVLTMKMLEVANSEKVISPVEGELIAINISKGETVAAGKTLFTVITASENNTLEAIVFINHMDGKKLAAGMDSYVLPNMLSQYDYGYIKGKLVSVTEYPATKEAALVYLGNMNLVDEFFAGGAPFMARIKLSSRGLSSSNMDWTTKKGAKVKINPGTTLTAKIITKTCSPWQLLTKH